jgi:hypothetical protein
MTTQQYTQGLSVKGRTQAYVTSAAGIRDNTAGDCCKACSRHRPTAPEDCSCSQHRLMESMGPRTQCFLLGQYVQCSTQVGSRAGLHLTYIHNRRLGCASTVSKALPSNAAPVTGTPGDSVHCLETYCCRTPAGTLPVPACCQPTPHISRLRVTACSGFTCSVKRIHAATLDPKSQPRRWQS